MVFGLVRSFCKFLNAKKSKIDPLHRVIAWKSKIIGKKKLNSGEFIGYICSFFAERKMK
jgi:alanine racemase